MAERNAFLDDFVGLLVNQWGYAAVLRSLTRVQGNLLTPSDADRSHYQLTGVSGRLKRRERANAATQISKMELPENNREILVELASRFDSGRFLPSMSDIRNFLETNHVHASSIQNRGAAVPKVFNILTSMPHQELKEMLEGGAYSGPTRLGPLSEAIQASRNVVRSNSASLLGGDREAERSTEASTRARMIDMEHRVRPMKPEGSE